jgi:hypothetical protein
VPGEESDLAEIIQSLLRVLDMAHVHTERQRDRIPDRPLADPDPVLAHCVLLLLKPSRTEAELTG